MVYDRGQNEFQVCLFHVLRYKNADCGVQCPEIFPFNEEINQLDLTTFDCEGETPTETNPMHCVASVENNVVF